ncbi:lactonase family protein [Paucibacter soli]|uniref:lactonase family protein n=1 Tax=Paucibacter soli TaxID=3133433 RepID=UPI0030A2058C
MRRRNTLQALACAPLMPSRASPAPVHAYLGSYGPEGLGCYLQDAESGLLQPRGRVENRGEPSWLCAAPDGGLLYAANEAASTLGVYARAADGGLRLLQERASGGVGPVHISLQGGLAFVAHYGSGEIACWRLDAQGLLGERLALLPSASGPGPSHAHMAGCDPSGRYLLASDLGQGSLLSWRLDEAAGRLGPPRVWQGPPGAGPRHFRFHPLRPQWLYLLNETASTLSWLHFDASDGSIRQDLTLSSLPAGHRGTSYASDLRITADGRHLYALNRLHDSIAIFELGRDGQPRLLGHEPSRGSYPRSAALSPDGRWLYVCNQRGGNVSRFWVQADGGLHHAGLQSLPAPAALVFVV